MAKELLVLWILKDYELRLCRSLYHTKISLTQLTLSLQKVLIQSGKKEKHRRRTTKSQK